MGKDFKSKNVMLRKCRANCSIRDVGFSRTGEGEKEKAKEEEKIARITDHRPHK